MVNSRGLQKKDCPSKYCYNCRASHDLRYVCTGNIASVQMTLVVAVLVVVVAGAREAKQVGVAAWSSLIVKLKAIWMADGLDWHGMADWQSNNPRVRLGRTKVSVITRMPATTTTSAPADFVRSPPPPPPIQKYIDLVKVCNCCPIVRNCITMHCCNSSKCRAKRRRPTSQSSKEEFKLQIQLYDIIFAIRESEQGIGSFVLVLAL